jgi:hypothetical protein
MPLRFTTPGASTTEAKPEVRLQVEKGSGLKAINMVRGIRQKDVKPDRVYSSLSKLVAGVDKKGSVANESAPVVVLGHRTGIAKLAESLNAFSNCNKQAQKDLDAADTQARKKDIKAGLKERLTEIFPGTWPANPLTEPHHLTLEAVTQDQTPAVQKATAKANTQAKKFFARALKRVTVASRNGLAPHAVHDQAIDEDNNVVTAAFNAFMPSDAFATRYAGPGHLLDARHCHLLDANHCDFSEATMDDVFRGLLSAGDVTDEVVMNTARAVFKEDLALPGYLQTTLSALTRMHTLVDSPTAQPEARNETPTVPNPTTPPPPSDDGTVSVFDEIAPPSQSTSSARNSDAPPGRDADNPAGIDDAPEVADAVDHGTVTGNEIRGTHSSSSTEPPTDPTPSDDGTESVFDEIAPPRDADNPAGIDDASEAADAVDHGTGTGNEIRRTRSSSSTEPRSAENDFTLVAIDVTDTDQDRESVPNALIAKADIEKGETVLQEILQRSTIVDRPAYQARYEQCFPFCTLSKGTSYFIKLIDEKKAEKSTVYYANHTDRSPLPGPNCSVTVQEEDSSTCIVKFKARRRINAGEEITYDYQQGLTKPEIPLFPAEASAARASNRRATAARSSARRAAGLRSSSSSKRRAAAAATEAIKRSAKRNKIFTVDIFMHNTEFTDPFWGKQLRVMPGKANGDCFYDSLAKQLNCYKYGDPRDPTTTGKKWTASLVRKFVSAFMTNAGGKLNDITKERLGVAKEYYQNVTCADPTPDPELSYPKGPNQGKPMSFEDLAKFTASPSLKHFATPTIIALAAHAFEVDIHYASLRIDETGKWHGWDAGGNVQWVSQHWDDFKCEGRRERSDAHPAPDRRRNVFFRRTETDYISNSHWVSLEPVVPSDPVPIGKGKGRLRQSRLCHVDQDVTNAVAAPNTTRTEQLRIDEELARKLMQEEEQKRAALAEAEAENEEAARKVALLREQ